MSEINTVKPRRAKRSLAVPAIVAGGLSSLLLAFSLTPTFSALTASILNDKNTAGTGTLVMQETGPGTSGTVTCTSGADGTGTCSTINKFAGNMAMKPGQAVTTTVTIKNTGTVAATDLTIKGGACTDTAQTGATVTGTSTNLCTLYKIKIDKTGPVSVMAEKTATAFEAAAASSVGPLAAGASVDVTFTVTLDASAGAGNQGRQISQPITWTFTV